MWLVVLLFTVTPTYADYSSLQTVLSQKGLQTASHWLTDWLQSKLSTIKIPDYRGSVDITIGTVDYVLHDMSIKKCDLPEPYVAFSEGTGITLQVSGLSVVITGSWKTHFGIINDSGWFDLAIFTLDLNTVLQLGSEDEHLVITPAPCSAGVGSVQANFHGGGSFIFQPFLKRFSGSIAQAIRAQICPAFQNGIKELNRHLAVMSAVKVDPYVYMNMSLTDSPIVMASALGLNITGEVYSIDFPSDPPFSPNYFDLPWQEDHMLSVGASEFCVNSAAYAFLRAGVLKKLITEDMIPKISPVHLNTSQFGVFIPQLPKLYPNMEMNVLLYANQTPTVSFSKTMISVHLYISAKVSAIKANSEDIPLFRLDMESSFSGKAYIEKQMLKGAVEMKNLTMTLGSTEIGLFSITAIEQAVNLAMSKFVLPKVNAQLKDGLPLPFMKCFSLSNSVLTIEDGFVMIATDIEKGFI